MSTTTSGTLVYISREIGGNDYLSKLMENWRMDDVSIEEKKTIAQEILSWRLAGTETFDSSCRGSWQEEKHRYHCRPYGMSNDWRECHCTVCDECNYGIRSLAMDLEEFRAVTP